MTELHGIGVMFRRAVVWLRSRMNSATCARYRLFSIVQLDRLHNREWDRFDPRGDL